MQFDWAQFQQRLKALQFQRSDFRARKRHGELHAKLGAGSTAMRTRAEHDTCGIAVGTGRHARGRQALAGQRGDTPNHTPAHRAPLVWRAPEGPEGQAAVPVGGGRAWPDNESTRRAKLAARAARGRAAAHRHTQRPGPPAPGTPAGPQAPRLKHSSPLPADPAPRMKHYSPTHTQNG